MLQTLTCCCVFFAILLADQPGSFGQLLFERPPIRYSESTPTDPVMRLAESIGRGDIRLKDDAKFGVLKSLLAELEIPISSQTLVFSKTSMQRTLISPSNPRAIYFNDETYVGWVPGGEVIEISSTDPMLGTTFYSIDQKTPAKSAEIVRRTDECLFCHASSDTGRVPGLLMHSLLTDADGRRVFPPDPSEADREYGKLVWPQPDGPIRARWAGWYVTGKHGNQTHLGNFFADSSPRISATTPRGNGNVTDLSNWIEPEKYLSPGSDLVALLVLQHQIAMHNLLTDTNHKTRHLIAQAIADGRLGAKFSAEQAVEIDRIAESLVDGFVGLGAVTFDQPVSGTSGFAEDFIALGQKDSQGRSFRDLDLSTRLFRYPCSPLIHSDSFRQLPSVVKQAAATRLVAVLSGKDKRPKYAGLRTETRAAALAILQETMPEVFSTPTTAE